MKNMKKMLATAMVLVMALSAVVIVSGDSSEAATDITYISGKIMDNQEYKAGAIVVQNGDLSIEAGKTLTIAQGASFTVASGYTLTVNDGAAFKVNNGALVVVDGKLNVKSGGKVVNGSIFDNTSKVDGKLAGFFVNGEMDVAKGSKIKGDNITGFDTGSITAVSVGVLSVAPWVSNDTSSTTDIQNYKPNISVAGGTDGKPYVVSLTGGVPVHMNGAGNWGAWVGVQVSSGDEVDYFYTTAGKTVQISVAGDSGTNSFILDTTGVAVSGPSGQIIVNGALTTTSSGLTHSSIKDQIISVSEAGKVSLKGDVSGTVVSAFTDSKNPYTYGAVLLDVAESAGPNDKSNVVVDLDFTVEAEKISVAFIGTDDNAESTKKAQDLILDVSGSIQGSYVSNQDYPVSLTVLKTVPSAGMEDNGARKVLYYSNGATEPKSSGVPMTGKVTVTESLSIGKNATFEVEPGAVFNITGKVTADGQKNASGTQDKAVLDLDGIVTVTGTMKVGDIGESLTSDGYFIVEDAGVVSLEGYSEFEPAFGAAYEDENGVFWIMSLSAAIAAAEAGDVSDVCLWSVAGEAGKIQKKDYKVSSDLVVPDGITLDVEGTITIASGSVMTIKSGADVTTTNGCLLDVKGTLIDETLMSDSGLYGTIVNNGEVHVNADVRSVDEDETAYTYTTLKSALAGIDSKIELFGNVFVYGALDLPQGKTVVLGEKNLTVCNDAELTVDGTLVADGNGKIFLMKENQSEKKAEAVIIINNIVVASELHWNGNGGAEESEKKVSGIYAEGTIGEYKDSEFILSPAVAAENSKTISNLEVKAKTSVSGKLTFIASADAEDAMITISADSVFGEIVIEGYEITIESNAALTATIVAVNTDGESSVKLDKVKSLSFIVMEDDSGDEPVKKFTIDTGDETTLEGNMTVMQGSVYIVGNLEVGTYEERQGNVLSVASGAELIVPEDSSISSVTTTGAPGDYAGLVIDGRLSVVKGSICAEKADSQNNSQDGIILVNGELFITESRNVGIEGRLVIKGTLNVDTAEKTAGLLTISGVLIVGEEPESLGAVASVVGAIFVNGTIIVYPGADMTGALINYNAITGESGIEKVDFIIGDDLYMTKYGSGVIKVPQEVTIVGFEPIGPTDWYVDSTCMTPLPESAQMEDYSAVYAKATPSTAYVQVSVGTGISLWIDGVKYDTGAEVVLKVGTYNVEATIDPGYKGTVRISFDGSQVTDGKMVVTPDMSIRAPGSVDNPVSFIVLSATGDISVDSGSVPAPTPVTPAQDDDSMGITEYLLIVLVVLAAILVVVVAIRMMRS